MVPVGAGGRLAKLPASAASGHSGNKSGVVRATSAKARRPTAREPSRRTMTRWWPRRMSSGSHGLDLVAREPVEGGDEPRVERPTGRAGS